MSRPAPALRAALAALCLAGCASVQAPPEAPSPAVEAYAAQRRSLFLEAEAAAHAADAAGRLREATWRWRIAQALAPAGVDVSYELQAALSRQASAVMQAVSQGDALRTRDPGGARLAYERALAVDPDQASVRETLRSLDAVEVLRVVARGSGGPAPRAGTRVARTQPVRKSPAHRPAPPAPAGGR